LPNCQDEKRQPRGSEQKASVSCLTHLLALAPSLVF
jgi:hypothetical protein